MTCAQCGQERKLVARGLCERCYIGLRRVGKLDRYPRMGQRRPPGAPRLYKRPVDWRAIAAEQKHEIDELRARIEELEHGT